MGLLGLAFFACGALALQELCDQFENVQQGNYSCKYSTAPIVLVALSVDNNQLIIDIISQSTITHGTRYDYLESALYVASYPLIPY